ncbi:hypothetical protein [Thermospira aquatica]|uniref:Uncharacterized protein n=1 Tax=Thermospira aquatica TaxID=2828656 RepID=A0AAX3BBE3_9SPIR|nr:hypothetical protein [Thermospira aquatica]URA09408.1 hypothetical protein KDW03_07890 [Thermospira aquatica]
MKRRFILGIMIILNLTTCGESKLKVDELKIIETKIVSESEPNTKPKEEFLDGIMRMAICIVSASSPLVDAYNSWEITHGKEIMELADEDPATAWISRDDGLTHYLWCRIYHLTGYDIKRKDRLPYAIDILPGWAKSKKTYKVYNRPKRIRLELYHIPFRYARNQYEDSYVLEDEIRLIYVVIAELRDELAWQRIRINIEDSKEYLGERMAGRLVIKDIYPGITNHTAISMIRFVYK